MAPEYVTVYQISKEPTDWSIVLAGAIPLVLGVVLILGKWRFAWKQPKWFTAIFVCVFGILWLWLGVLGTPHGDPPALTDFQKGYYQLVEGNVTDFRPMPYEGHQEECFSVQNERFCYSDYILAPGFRNTASHGGPIRSGLPVRIAYADGSIVRLEIPKDRVLKPSEILATTASAEKAWQAQENNNPIQRRMTLAFCFTAICWTLWWNLQWKLVMRFWVRPPNRLWVQYVFRTFFAFNLMGAIWQFAKELHSHPVVGKEIMPTIEITLVMCAVVAMMSAFGLWMSQRRDRKEIDPFA